MSLDKAIEHGREHRRAYRRAKAVSLHCRNHGDCPHCRGNRTFQEKKEKERTKVREEEG